MLKNHVPSIKFWCGFAGYLAIALTCSIALKLAAVEVLRGLEVPSDRPMVTNYDAKR